MKFVYGDSWWVDLDRIDDEWEEIAEYDRPQADRFFVNVIGIGADSAFDIDAWKHRADSDFVVPAGEWVTVGFDGAKFWDSTGLIGTHVETGYQWVIGAWERPTEADEDWEVDEEEVTSALAATFETYRVWREYADPPYWEDTIDRWASRWGGRRVIKWWTNRPRPMAFAIRNYAQAMKSVDSDLRHDGHERFTAHIANARRAETTVKDDDDKPMFLIRKEYPKSPLKIDLAMAGCLSWEARGDAIAAGVLKRGRRTGGGSM